MTILNNANDGDYPILRNVLNVLILSDNCIDKDKLFKACGKDIGLPDGKKLDSKHINNTFLTWNSLGLLQMDGDEISIDGRYFDEITKIGELSEKNLRLLLIDILLSPENNQNFWPEEGGEEGGGSSDFTRGSAYLLARDIFYLNGNFDAFADSDAKKGSTRKIVQNSNRWASLMRWMKALDLMNSGFIADPTVLVKSFIENYKEVETSSLSDFVDKLGIKFPILDGGKYRQKLESELVGPSFDLLRQNKLSVSLSLSLRRLENQGYIELLNKSDAAKLSLTGKGVSERTSFSHINIKKVKK
ncbi:protein DpdG [Paracoccaceae bacterium]|nr:protein DpdG [Paracoccaceae bacterium]